MTKKMNRFRALLLDNKILLIVVIGMCLAVFLTAWRASLRCATGSIRTAYDAYWEYWEGTDMTAKGVLTNDYGTYLFDEDNRTLLAGPFAGIAAEDFEFTGTIARFETADGKIGFIDESGREVISAFYTSATGFSEGHSVVTDEDGNRYEIDAYAQREPL